MFWSINLLIYLFWFFQIFFYYLCENLNKKYRVTKQLILENLLKRESIGLRKINLQALYVLMEIKLWNWIWLSVSMCPNKKLFKICQMIIFPLLKIDVLQPCPQYLKFMERGPKLVSLSQNWASGLIYPGSTTPRDEDEQRTPPQLHSTPARHSISPWLKQIGEFAIEEKPIMLLLIEVGESEVRESLIYSWWPERGCWWTDGVGSAAGRLSIWCLGLPQGQSVSQSATVWLRPTIFLWHPSFRLGCYESFPPISGYYPVAYSIVFVDFWK